MQQRANRYLGLYSHSPKLHSHLLIGSLQLLSWLFFHPSAWKNYLQDLDTNLRPDFYLAELGWAKRFSPALNRFLLQAYLVLPLLVGLLVSLGLCAFRIPATDIAFGVAVGVSACIAGSLAGGIVVGVAVSLASSFIGGTVVGLLFGAVVGTAKLADLGWGLGSTAASVGVLQSFIHPVSLMGINASNVAASVAVSVAKQKRDRISISQQFIGVISGLSISLVTLLIVAKAAENFVGDGISERSLMALGLLMGGFYGAAAGWRTRRWKVALPCCLVLGVCMGAAVSMGLNIDSAVVRGIAIGGGNAALLTTLFALPYVLSEKIAGTWLASIVGIVGSGGVYIIFASGIGETPLSLTLPLSALCILLGLTMSWWRPALFYPLQRVWNGILYRIEAQQSDSAPSLLRWNAAFWDEFQYIPLTGLDQHLLRVMEKDPAVGDVAIAHLNTGHQRWAAQAAQIERDARNLEACDTITAISQAHQTLEEGELIGPASALLQSLRQVSTDVSAALLQRSHYNQRLALSAVVNRLEGLQRMLVRSGTRRWRRPFTGHQLTESHSAPRFQPILQAWHQIVSEHMSQLLIETEQRQELDSPYVIGVPLTAQQELFVGRVDIGEKIERLLRDDRSPPLLLYGQRRMGKTSLLNNLGRLLPHTVIPLFIDLQGPTSQASNHAGFLYNLARAMSTSAKQQRRLIFPTVERAAFERDPVTTFDEWLDQVELCLGNDTALLALDEFEVLARVLEQGRFEEPVILGLLRNLIQHRPRFKVLLAGTHTLEAFHHWASYLINLQVVHISYLTQSEARQLIEYPVPAFALRYEPDATQRILDLTRCHPFLVQLLCAEVVALKNDQDVAVRRFATLADIDAVVPAALESASFFFADIERNQLSPAGAAALRSLAAPTSALEWQHPRVSAEIIRALIQRDLIECVNGQYRFQVELIRRWFAQDEH